MTTKDRISDKKKKKILPNEITFMLKTQIPGLQEIEYMPYMTIPREKNRHIYFDPLIKLSEEIINKVPEDLRIKQFFDANLFKSLVNSHASIRSDSIGRAMYDGNIEHNISIMLKLLFNQNEHIYINKKQYTIVDNDCDDNSWRIGVKSKKISNYDTKQSTGPYANMVIFEEIERGNQQLKRLKDDEAYGPNYTGEKSPFVETDVEKEEVTIDDVTKETESANTEPRKEFEKDVEKEELVIDDVTKETEPSNLPQIEYEERKQITNGNETVEEETESRVEDIAEEINNPKAIEDDPEKTPEQLQIEDDTNKLPEKTPEQLQIEDDPENTSENTSENTPEKTPEQLQIEDDTNKLPENTSENTPENTSENPQMEGPSTEPSLNIDERNTELVQEFFNQSSYFNIIDTLYKNLDVNAQKLVMSMYRQTSNIVNDNQQFIESLYRDSVSGIRVIENEGGGNCFFIAVAQGINYYNYMNTRDKIIVNGHGLDDKLITQRIIREITYEYIYETFIKDKSEKEVNDYIQNHESVLFLDDLSNAFSEAIKGKENIDISTYTDILKNVYINNQNYLVTYDTDNNGVPTSFTEPQKYNTPFRLITSNELKDYILSDKYWGDTTAIEAVKNKLGLVVAPLEITKKNVKPGETEISRIRMLQNYFTDNDDKELHKDVDNEWNKYMFLFYQTSHFELIQFSFNQPQKNNNTKIQGNVTIFNRNSDNNTKRNINTNYLIPLYIILILFASSYVTLNGNSKHKFGLLKKSKIFDYLCASMNKIKKKYYELDNKRDIKSSGVTRNVGEKNKIEIFMQNIKKYFSDIEYGLLSDDCNSKLPDNDKKKIETIKSENKKKKKGGDGENDLIKSNYIRPSQYQQPYPPQYRTQYQQPYPPQYPPQYHQQENVKYISHESYNQLSYYIDVVLVLTTGESIDPSKASQLNCDNKRMKVSRSFNKLIGNNAPLQPDYDLLAKKNVDDNKNMTVKKGGRHTKNKKGKTTRKKRKYKRKNV